MQADQRVCDIICSLLPSFFVIENVAGLYRFHKHRAFLNRKIFAAFANTAMPLITRF